MLGVIDGRLRRRRPRPDRGRRPRSWSGCSAVVASWSPSSPAPSGNGLAARCEEYVADRHAHVDVVVYDGGQERYPLLIVGGVRTVITLDSPVATVLGAQTKRGQGQEASPRASGCAPSATCCTTSRVATSGPASSPRSRTSRRARCSPSSARSSRARSTPTATAAPTVTAYRLDTTLQTDGPSLRMTFFAKTKHVSDWHARTSGRRAPRRSSSARSSTFRGEVAAHQPDDGALRQ